MVGREGIRKSKLYDFAYSKNKKHFYQQGS